MRIGTFTSEVTADFIQSLQVYFGDFITLPHLLQVPDFVGEFLEDIVTDFPVKGEDD